MQNTLRTTMSAELANESVWGVNFPGPSANMANMDRGADFGPEPLHVFRELKINVWLTLRACAFLSHVVAIH